MKTQHVLRLLVLAALWGASFLLMRLGAADFGPVALAAVRVTGAAIFLVPIMLWQRQAATLRGHWLDVFVIGITNSALPFLFFSYAALSMPAGLSAVFNATSPLFGALIAWAWLGDRLTASRVMGLALGFGGVAWLVASRGGLTGGPVEGTALATAACLGGTLCYGFAASYTKRRLQGVPSIAVAAASQVTAAAVLAVPAFLMWPTAPISVNAWAMAAVLAIACTGVAYAIYFRLIAEVGPAQAISVTFLIPLFAMLWGGLLLGESVSATMLLSCATILAGTGLTTGLVKPPSRRQLPL